MMSQCEWHRIQLRTDPAPILHSSGTWDSHDCHRQGLELDSDLGTPEKASADLPFMSFSGSCLCLCLLTSLLVLIHFIATLVRITAVVCSPIYFLLNSCILKRYSWSKEAQNSYPHMACLDSTQKLYSACWIYNKLSPWCKHKYLHILSPLTKHKHHHSSSCMLRQMMSVLRHIKSLDFSSHDGIYLL